MGGREGKEDSAFRASVRGLADDLRPEDHQRRDHFPNQTR